MPKLTFDSRLDEQKQKRNWKDTLFKNDESYKMFSGIFFRE